MPPQTLAPGTRLGPYEVVAPLGAEGMGEVYRARDTNLQRDAALKVLPEGLDRTNVWLQPLDGKPARRITSFEDQLVFDFDISRDGSTLAVVRGPRLRDAHLVTGFDGSSAP